MYENITLKNIIENSIAKFSYYHSDKLYYEIIKNGTRFVFPVPCNDTGTGVLHPEEKAIILMRWIRKSIETETLYIEKYEG